MELLLQKDAILYAYCFERNTSVQRGKYLTALICLMALLVTSVQVYHIVGMNVNLTKKR
ncbi:hypothetical protein QFZ77_002539 [Paenibacillus sp. V4I3]|nr:hypothetical protein [Paenibacillus sp. V4I3]